MTIFDDFMHIVSAIVVVAVGPLVVYLGLTFIHEVFIKRSKNIINFFVDIKEQFSIILHMFRGK